MCVGVNDVQAYVWLYPGYLGLSLFCVSVLQENSD